MQTRYRYANTSDANRFSLTNPQMDTEERPIFICSKKFRQRPVKDYKKCRLVKIIMQSVLAAMAGMLFFLNLSSSLRNSFLAHTESELISKIVLKRQVNYTLHPQDLFA